MQTYTTFLGQRPFHNQLIDTIEHIDSIYSKINLILHEDLYSLEKDSYHFIGKMLTQLGKNDRASQAFASMLFRSVYRGEVTSAGAGHIAFTFGLAFARQLLRTDLMSQNETKTHKELKRALEYFKSQLRASTVPTGPEDIRKAIKASCGSDEVLAMVIWEALQLSGMEGKIFVENGRQDNYVVEHKEGYNFDLQPFGFMLQNGKTWNARDCKTLIVDGLVEKVSEIDHLLTETLKTKQPMVIIAHGFSEEVVATLKANQERGLLDIQPIRIPSDIGSLNVANDISVVCGTLPVSAMKGDLLVFVKYAELPIVDHIRLVPQLCTIENSKTRTGVSEQIRSLLEKRQSYYLHEDVQELFDKRMRSLVSNTVNICLPNGPVTVQDECRIRIDMALRQTKTMLNHGIVNLNQVIIKSTTMPMQKCGEVGRCFRAALIETATMIKQDQSISTLSALIACELASKNILMFLTASGFVETQPSIG